MKSFMLKKNDESRQVCLGYDSAEVVAISIATFKSQM